MNHSVIVGAGAWGRIVGAGRHVAGAGLEPIKAECLRIAEPEARLGQCFSRKTLCSSRPKGSASGKQGAAIHHVQSVPVKPEAGYRVNMSESKACKALMT